MVREVSAVGGIGLGGGARPGVRGWEEEPGRGYGTGRNPAGGMGTGRNGSKGSESGRGYRVLGGASLWMTLLLHRSNLLATQTHTH